MDENLDPASSHPSGWPDDLLLAECDVRRQRRSGPGGQHRNKVETGIVITHRPSGVRVEATERRSQKQNHDVAVRRLRLKLATDVRTPDVATAPPSPLWRSRCRNRRIVISENHADFPALLAEALDQVAACDDDLPRAAEHLDCTSSQLVKLLKREPRALEVVNRSRGERGLSRLN